MAGENKEGNENIQLNQPVNVMVDKENDSLIICDIGNRRVVRQTRQNDRNEETIISNIVCWDLIVGTDGYFYIPDVHKQQVRRWKMGEINGIMVVGGNERGHRLDQLTQPY